MIMNDKLRDIVVELEHIIHYDDNGNLSLNKRSALLDAIHLIKEVLDT